MKYKGIIFDMDGTLTVPAIDFFAVRRELGIESGCDIVKVLASRSQEEQKKAWALIEKYEEEVRNNTVLQTGCRDALVKFKDSGLKLGLLTRNSQKGVDSFLKLIDFQFDTVLTREHTHIKPSPKPVYHILEEWGLLPERILLVGDYIHDIECGNSAGADTCFFANPGATSYAKSANFSVASFAELDILIF